MAVVTDYCTVAELNEYLLGTGKTQALQAGNFAAAVSSASRFVDRYCGRRFYVDDAVSARVFTADHYTEILVPDIATATDLVLKTDEDVDGVYETVWQIGSFTGAGFRLWPYNAAADVEMLEPFTRIRAIATAFPIGELAVEVTALWGWPAVPADVHQATLLQAARFWKRKDATLGVGGAAETGFFELRKSLDVDVKNLLDPYRNFAQPVLP